ncbi:hypothetical protein [Kineococcus auxinigenes]|uniref:hypothetical protein n=1 Tax=unclassified Kineococcus TaxID=2621656 RepID=UPI003D7E8C53
MPPSAGFGLRSITCDLVRAGFLGPDGLVQLAEVDGRATTAETAGSFTGRCVGVYATTGRVAVDRFTYEGQDDPR